MRYYDSATSLVGRTPLLLLSKMALKYGWEANVFAKLEYFNPGGSVKDRVALSMIEDAEQRGLLKKGATIIEPTSGNTGVGIAWVSKVKGYHCILTMPETMSIERRKLLKAMGAEVILTEGSKGMKGSIEKAKALHREIEGSLILGQFSNPANPKAHILSTTKEIWEDLEGNIDALIAGVGTGGTLIGCSKGLKSHNPKIKSIGVEPLSSPVLSGGKAGMHKLQGIGANFVPEIYEGEWVDEIMQVSNEDAYKMVRELADLEGILVGISSGATLSAATQYAQREENKGKNIVVILPDGGERYLSTDLFEE
ncbi:MAG TPA: cysteine synthase A [Porphyromonadaceae bacterium]|nr:cysteine synthase A [Porphyromonadaceae bacterium]